MDYAEPPGWLLADAWKYSPEKSGRGRAAPGWPAGEAPGVVLQQQAASGPNVCAEDVTWLHAFLTRLAGLGFPSPRPVSCFAGRSWTMADGALWEVVSFLPGWMAG